jgi:NDP-sugar pyrophosphorylase family protein
MPSEPRHAVILAGGKGTRLAPYTTILPKPLMPVDDMPILEIVLRQLREYGFERITISVGHLAELIMAFFGNGEKLGLDICYAIEDQPLGTIGPLRLIDLGNQPFLVMNGDILTDLDYSALYRHHIDNGGLLTIATCRKSVDITLGVLEYGSDQSVTGFREKPRLAFDVSMGVYVMNPEIVEIVPPGVAYGFDRLVLDMLAGKRRLKVYPTEGLWLDIGRAEDYGSARDCFVQHRARFLPETGKAI